MDNYKGYIMAAIIGGIIWFSMKSCEDKPKEENIEPINIITPDSSSAISNDDWEPDIEDIESDWKPLIEYIESNREPDIEDIESEIEEEYEYTYSTPSTVVYNTDSDEDNYEDWETEDIEGFYVKLDDCETDEQAEYISEEYYSGDYIDEGGYYYAKTTVKSGVYEVELGDRINSKFFKIRGTDCYIRFKWMTSLWRWDEGVMDVWNSKGTFYIKPD